MLFDCRSSFPRCMAESLKLPSCFPIKAYTAYLRTCISVLFKLVVGHVLQVLPSDLPSEKTLLTYIAMAQTQFSTRESTPLYSRKEVSETHAFVASLARRHSEPFLVNSLARSSPDQSGFFGSRRNKPQGYDGAFHIDISGKAYGDDDSAPMFDFSPTGRIPESSTGSKESSTASSPEPQVKKGPPRGQQQQLDVISDPDYDYWADVAHTW